jgi:lysozyme
MNMQRIMDQLAIDEGKSLTVYLDKYKKPTCGIGHLVTPGDRLFVGDTINEVRCSALFEHDLDIAIKDARNLMPCFDSLPEAAQEVLVNMAFNLGLIHLSTFDNMLNAMAQHDWLMAAEEMLDSKWCKVDCPERAKRLADKIRGLA